LRLTTITRPRHPGSDPPLFFFTLLKLSPPRPRSGGEHRVTDRERGARWPDHSQRGHPQAPQDPRGPPARRPQQTWRTAPEFIYLNSSSFTEAPLFCVAQLITSSDFEGDRPGAGIVHKLRGIANPPARPQRIHEHKVGTIIDGGGYLSADQSVDQSVEI